MGHHERLIFLALAVGWTLFRWLRYLRTGASRRPRSALPAATSPGTAQSPIEPAGRSRLPRMLAAAGVLIAGNAVIWPLLFATSALEDVPTMPRLVAGVLANLVLIRVASGAAARVTGRSQPGADDDRNPIK